MWFSRLCICVIWFDFKEDTLLHMNEKLNAFDSDLEEFQQEHAWINIRGLWMSDVLIFCLSKSIILKRTASISPLYSYLQLLNNRLNGFLFTVLPLIIVIILLWCPVCYRFIHGSSFKKPSLSFWRWSSLFSHAARCHRLPCYFHSPNLESSTFPRIPGFF